MSRIGDFFSSLLPRGASRKAATTEDILRELYGGRTSSAGVAVTTDTALRLSAVFACLRVLSEGVAQVPLRVMRTDGDTRLPAKEHPLYRVLHSQASEVQTSFAWRETVMLHAALCGNHYSFINRDPRGLGVRELLPFVPNRVQPKRSDDGVLTYTVSMDNGRTVVLPARDVFHVRGPSWDGWLGMDVLDAAREAVGLAAAAEQESARQYANGVQMRGIYSVDGALRTEQYKALRDWLVAHHSGENANMPMVLDRGAKFTPTSMTGVSAQKVEERKMQVEEVCRYFRVMPIMVGLADKTATYASSEQMFLAHVVHTLTPWYARIEQAIDAQLLGARDTEDGYYARFFAQGLMRGSMQDRSDYYAKALGAGGSPAWMTQDEVRALEDLNPAGGEASVLPKPTNVSTTNRPSGGGRTDDEE